MGDDTPFSPAQGYVYALRGVTAVEGLTAYPLCPEVSLSNQGCECEAPQEMGRETCLATTIVVVVTVMRESEREVRGNTLIFFFFFLVFGD